jgi:hypothetical protein
MQVPDATVVTLVTLAIQMNWEDRVYLVNVVAISTFTIHVAVIPSMESVFFASTTQLDLTVSGAKNGFGEMLLT